MHARSPRGFPALAISCLVIGALSACNCAKKARLDEGPPTEETTTETPDAGLALNGLPTGVGHYCTDLDGDGYGDGPGCAGKDCDDNDPTFNTEGVRSCYGGPASAAGVGACTLGTETCRNGVLSACTGWVAPSTELCDNVDNNCDGLVDNGVMRSCYTGPSGSDGVGLCTSGAQVCVNGSFGPCLAQSVPMPETCDGVDNNCNGQIDENVTSYTQDGEQQTVTVTLKPVDIIFVIDNSGSMAEEIDAVQRNINNNFASIIGGSGIDYRVIMVSRHGSTTAQYAICVQSPLSGNGNCQAPISQCPVNGPRFFQYSVDIDSHASFSQLIGTYNTPDACGLAPKGWSQWLRPEAFKIFIELSDDGPSSGNPTSDNSYTADTFESKLFALTPAMFGTKDARNYMWHSIVGLHENNPALAAWLPTQPLVNTECTANGGHVVQPALEYQKLSIRTGGLRYPICEYSSFDAVFRDVAAGVVQSAKMDCTFQINTIPAGSSTDDTLMTLIPSNGGGTVSLSHVGDAGACTGNQFYTSGTSFTLCPAACTAWQRDPTAKVQVDFTCGPQL